MKIWKILYAVIILLLAIILAGIATGRNMFQTSLEYYTALLLFGISMIALLISAFVRRERYSCSFAYSGISLMLTAAFAYAIKTEEFSYASILFYVISLLITLALYNRFGKLKYLDDFWIILLSATGFWIIILKFSREGLLLTPHMARFKFSFQNFKSNFTMPPLFNESSAAFKAKLRFI